MPPLAITLHEWEERSPDGDPLLVGVSLDRDPAVRAAASELTRQGKVEIVELRTGLLIRTTSYVGRVQLGDLHLTIRPKIPFDPLLTLLRYAFHLRDVMLFSPAEYDTPPDAFQELLIHELAAEAGDLMAHGLLRRYTPVRESLAAPRGRIDVQRIIRQGGVQDAALPSTHYPRLEDSLINQVLLAGLYLASGLTGDGAQRSRLRRLASAIEEHVSRVALHADLLRRVDRQMNRLTAAYRPALALIALLLEGSGSVLDEDQTGPDLPGFLFDMNRFFEALVSRFLHENLPGYTVTDQYRLRGLLSYAPGRNPQRRQAPTPRPDYVISRDGTVVAVLDAKYRDIWTNGLPREMLYQLALYALSQSAGGSAAIVYPTIDTDAQPEAIDIREVIHGEHRGQVALRPLNLLRLEVLIRASGAQAERERHGLAASLAL
ncbi:MAG: restriction endonuclease, partial [Chloroflexi bacterium]